MASQDVYGRRHPRSIHSRLDWPRNAQSVVKRPLPHTASREEKAICQNCGHATVRNVPRITGLRELLVREAAEDLYKECHNARHGLVHGFMNIEQVAEVARARTKDVGRLLAEGIAVLSGVPLPDDPKKFASLGGFRVATVVFAEGTIAIRDLNAYSAVVSSLSSANAATTAQTSR